MLSVRNILLAFVLLFQFEVFGQFFDNVVYNRKALYGEIYGNGLGASVNYEYLFHDHTVKQGIRGGPGFFVNFLAPNSPTIISGNIEYISFAGARNHHLEWGLGLSYQYKYYRQNYQTTSYLVTVNGSSTDTTTYYTDHTYKYQRTGPAIVPRIGYRYESPDGGLIVRIGYTPLIYLFNSEKEFIDGTKISSKLTTFGTNFAWGGLSIGFSFY